MQLIGDFWFDDGAKRWFVRAGTVVDGASIPQPLWAIVGSPYTGDYRRASIVHDVACVEAGKDGPMRRAADRMFFRACRVGGCSTRQAIILYVGVRIGGALHRARTLAGLDQPVVKTRADATDIIIREQFSDAAEEVLAFGETDDVDLIEQRTNAAIAARASQWASLERLSGALAAASREDAAVPGRG